MSEHSPSCRNSYPPCQKCEDRVRAAIAGFTLAEIEEAMERQDALEDLNEESIAQISWLLAGHSQEDKPSIGKCVSMLMIDAIGDATPDRIRKALETQKSIDMVEAIMPEHLKKIEGEKSKPGERLDWICDALERMDQISISDWNLIWEALAHDMDVSDKAKQIGGASPSANDERRNQLMDLIDPLTRARREDERHE
jgi:hypothetical protein